MKAITSICIIASTLALASCEVTTNPDGSTTKKLSPAGEALVRESGKAVIRAAASRFGPAVTSERK